LAAASRISESAINVGGHLILLSRQAAMLVVEKIDGQGIGCTVPGERIFRLLFVCRQGGRNGTAFKSIWKCYHGSSKKGTFVRGRRSIQ
jgi:hypothetical protein